MAVVASYAEGPRAGQAAITRRPAGAGSAAYVSTRLGAHGLADLLPRLLDEAGVVGELPPEVRGRVELAVRADERAEYWFLVNRTQERVSLAGITGEVLDPVEQSAADALTLAPRGVAVVRKAGDAPR
nr:Beta-galactosidase C-terminal domain [Streptomonospora litoralis]